MTYIHDFDEPCEEGRALLGGKGLGLAEMTQLGLPVPRGFTITTEACRVTMRTGHEPPALSTEVAEHLARLERATGKRFGDVRNPLLLSVRSGGPISMPGMMETVLNLGLNRRVVESDGFGTDRRFAFDAYRRLLQMYGTVVAGIDADAFESVLADVKARCGVDLESSLSADDLAEIAQRFEELYLTETSSAFPDQPYVQLGLAIQAVFESWNAPRAQVYRHEYGIADDLGTAVNVMEMVFGNRDEHSATGVCFSRDPATGRPGLFGEYLADAQGEDIVSGARTPEPIARMRERFPEAYDELERSVAELERHYRDMQDVEFTIECGRLHLLQTRGAKRTAAAALACAVALVDDGLIDRAEAVRRIEPASLDQLLHPTIDPDSAVDVVAVGLAASPGAACGRAVFDADRAAEQAAAGGDVILVRPETTPDDIHGLIGARGVLTARGGMTSHAAVVARGMGKPCVAGCSALHVDLGTRTADVAGHAIREGDVITIDGTSGHIILGPVELVEPEPNADLAFVLEWADDLRRLGVRANADTPVDARRAQENGAEGIGLCRTEHMFMADDRLPIVRAMILAATDDERAAALARLLPLQQGDFEGLFEAMGRLPVTIRLLDPPLHEFLPPLEEVHDEKTRERVLALREANPMLGTRGCRLGLEWPEIYEMQIRAIVRAAHAVQERTGVAPTVEIMHPLVAFDSELVRLRELTARTVAEEGGLDYRCGTMIELPRAALRAGELAHHADFFSFGTNDLTQTTLGFSRDDAEGRFLTYYLEHGILEKDPFATLDVDGVGELIRLAVERGRASNPEIHVGICGEHGGDPASIAFCEEAGLDYVSCSPFRLPVARLAAAQAVLAHDHETAYVPAGG
jgi:pyruvate,orthophosphate dikinase